MIQNNTGLSFCSQSDRNCAITLTDSFKVRRKLYPIDFSFEPGIPDSRT